jgi:hypothetical protein
MGRRPVLFCHSRFLAEPSPTPVTPRTEDEEVPQPLRASFFLRNAWLLPGSGIMTDDLRAGQGEQGWAGQAEAYGRCGPAEGWTYRSAERLHPTVVQPVLSSPPKPCLRSPGVLPYLSTERRLSFSGDKRLGLQLRVEIRPHDVDGLASAAAPCVAFPAEVLAAARRLES